MGSDAVVQTVTGPLDAAALGRVLVHEHLFIDLRSHWQPVWGGAPTPGGEAAASETERIAHNDVLDLGSTGACRRNPFELQDNLLLDDAELACAEVAEFGRLGGSTIVELTPPDIGRDPQALRRVATATGVNVICGTGHYIHLAHPDSVARDDVGALTEQLLADLLTGVDSSGIRAGVIGEIGTSNPVHPDEEKVLRAAARAQRQAEVPIVVHLSPPPRGGWWQAGQVLDILEQEGADPSHVLLAHIDNTLAPGEAFDRAVAYQRELLGRGCFLGYDGFGKDHYFPAGGTTPYPSFWCPSDPLRAKAIATLLDEDFAAQLLVSHDVCFKMELRRHGGFGYGYLLTTVPRILTDHGIEEAQLERWLTDNPRRLFAGTW